MVVGSPPARHTDEALRHRHFPVIEQREHRTPETFGDGIHERPCLTEIIVGHHELLHIHQTAFVPCSWSPAATSEDDAFRRTNRRRPWTEE